jgi:nucleoside-diphosphate-sugar epimerase
MKSMSPHLLLFGPGYVGLKLAEELKASGWTVAGTARTPEKARRLEQLGVEAVDPMEPSDLQEQVIRATAILVTAPPEESGCPGLNALVPAIARAAAFPDWIGYLSSTGVYGDRAGRWVFEGSPLLARSLEGARRVAAERDWLEVGRGMGLTVQIFRLPGIYGPGRSALDRVASGTARRLIRAGQVFSRAHCDDIASALQASIRQPRAGAIYNVCDDQPGPPQDVIEEAAILLGLPVPPDQRVEDIASAASSRFYGESKRVSNALLKAELGWRPKYPSYKSGLKSILDLKK